MSPRRVSLASVAFLNAGIRAGSRAVSALICWGIVADSLGREPSHEEVWTYWRTSKATHYRDQAAFRKAFPGETSPQRLWLLVRGEIKSRDRVGATAEAFGVVMP